MHNSKEGPEVPCLSWLAALRSPSLGFVAKLHLLSNKKLVSVFVASLVVAPRTTKGNHVRHKKGGQCNNPHSPPSITSVSRTAVHFGLGRIVAPAESEGRVSVHSVLSKPAHYCTTLFMMSIETDSVLLLYSSNQKERFNPGPEYDLQGYCLLLFRCCVLHSYP